MSLYDLTTKTLDDKPADLGQFRGKVTLAVNVASECGFTPQYAGLQALHDELAGRGFSVLGFPSNEFGGQEPGTPVDIMHTAHDEYGVRFPLAAKTEVRGTNPHPFYKWAAEARPREVPKWNFHKYLIGRDGYIAEVFSSVVEPADTRIKTAIAKSLADT